MKRLMKHFYYNVTNRTILFTLAFVIVSIVLVKIMFSDLFWQDFLSNLFATFLGIIIGIPIALVLSQLQESESERERKHKILRLLWKELLSNQVQLAGWRKSGDKQKEALTLHALLRVESWRAFSDGGELEWIRDPALLDVISEAYFAIKSVQTLSERYFDIRTSSNLSNSNWAEEDLFTLLGKGVQYTEEILSETFDAIGKETSLAQSAQP